MPIKLARSIAEAKSLVDSLLLPGICVDDKPSRIGRPRHPLIDIVYVGVLAAMTGRSHRRVVEIVTVEDLEGRRVPRAATLAKRLREDDTLAALAGLVHGSAETARSEGCECIDGPDDLDPRALAASIADAVGPFEPGSSKTPDGRVAAVLCRACAHNMVVFGEEIDPDGDVDIDSMRAHVDAAKRGVVSAERDVYQAQRRLDSACQMLAQARLELQRAEQNRRLEILELERLVEGHFDRGDLAFDFDEILRVRTAQALSDYGRQWAMDDPHGRPAIVNAVIGIFGCWVDGFSGDPGQVIESALSEHIPDCRRRGNIDAIDDARLTEPLGRVWLDLHGATAIEAVTVSGHPNRSLVASIARALLAIVGNPRQFDGRRADWTGREPQSPDAVDVEVCVEAVITTDATDQEVANPAVDDVATSNLIGPGRPPPTPAEPAKDLPIDVDDLPQILML